MEEVVEEVEEEVEKVEEEDAADLDATFCDCPRFQV